MGPGLRARAWYFYIDRLDLGPTDGRNQARYDAYDEREEHTVNVLKSVGAYIENQPALRSFHTRKASVTPQA